MSERGIIKRVVYPAGKRIVGKERGEWMKLTDDEARLIEERRAAEKPEPQRHWQLRLEHYDNHYVVIDTIALEVMCRFDDPYAAERFMRAFVARTPGAELDAWSISHATASVKVPDEVVVQPVTAGDARAAVTPRPTNVIPIRKASA